VFIALISSISSHLASIHLNQVVLRQVGTDWTQPRRTWSLHGVLSSDDTKLKILTLLHTVLFCQVIDRRWFSRICSDWYEYWLTDINNDINTWCGLLSTTVAADAWVGWSVAVETSCVCVCVCVCPRSERKTTQELLSTLNLAQVYSTCQSLGMRWPQGQKVEGQGHMVIKCAADMHTYAGSTPHNPVTLTFDRLTSGSMNATVLPLP